MLREIEGGKLIQSSVSMQIHCCALNSSLETQATSNLWEKGAQLETSARSRSWPHGGSVSGCLRGAAREGTSLGRARPWSSGLSAIPSAQRDSAAVENAAIALLGECLQNVTRATVN